MPCCAFAWSCLSCAPGRRAGVSRSSAKWRRSPRSPVRWRRRFDAICDILVPDLADFCMIDLIEGDRVAPSRRAGRAGCRRGGRARPARARRPRLPEWMVEGEGGPSEPRFIERMSEADLRRAWPMTTVPTSSSCAAWACVRRSPWRSAGAGQSDRHADARRRLVAPALPQGRRALRLDPLRARRARARQQRPLCRPRAGRKRAGGDRRNPAARPAAAAASASSPAGRWRRCTGRRAPRTR